MDRCTAVRRTWLILHSVNPMSAAAPPNLTIDHSELTHDTRFIKSLIVFGIDATNQCNVARYSGASIAK